MQEDRKSKGPRRGVNPIIIVLAVLLIGALAAAAYFYDKAYGKKGADPAKEVASIVMQVGKLMVLPTDETPTMATVTDPEKLQNQTFFKNAKEGDKVLIYSHAGKAILYDPLLRKIVEVAPINLDGIE
jgi:hypothetical protein